MKELLNQFNIAIMGKFELFIGKDNQHYFNLKAANGEIIIQSQGYSSKDAAKNGINSVKTNAVSDSQYERKTSSSEQHYFVLKAGNGESIGKSQMYSSKQSMETGIESVKTNAPTAAIEDLA